MKVIVHLSNRESVTLEAYSFVAEVEDGALRLTGFNTQMRENQTHVFADGTWQYVQTTEPMDAKVANRIGAELERAEKQRIAEEASRIAGQRAPFGRPNPYQPRWGEEKE